MTDQPSPEPAESAPAAPPAPPVPAESDKAALRAWVRQRRRAAGHDPSRATRIADSFYAVPGVADRLRPGAVVLAYVSLRHEPPTEVLRKRLRAMGVNVLVPIAGVDGTLTWLPDPGDAARAWGVPGQPAPPAADALLAPPDHVAIVVVPALAVTPDGRRLGQGGGYYDRLLARLPRADVGGPLRVALVGSGEVLESIPTAEHDAGVDTAVVG